MNAFHLTIDGNLIGIAFSELSLAEGIRNSFINLSAPKYMAVTGSLVSQYWQHSVVFGNMPESVFPKLMDDVCVSFDLKNDKDIQKAKIFMVLANRLVKYNRDYIVKFLELNQLSLDDELVVSLAICFNKFLNNKEVSYIASTRRSGYVEVPNAGGRNKIDIGEHFSKFFSRIPCNHHNEGEFTQIMFVPEGCGTDLFDTPANREFLNKTYVSIGEIQTYKVISTATGAYWYAKEYMTAEQCNYLVQKAIYENMRDDEKREIDRYNFINEIPKSLVEIIAPITRKFNAKGVQIILELS